MCNTQEANQFFCKLNKDEEEYFSMHFLIQIEYFYPNFSNFVALKIWKYGFGYCENKVIESTHKDLKC